MAPLVHGTSLTAVFPGDFSRETCKTDKISVLLADASSNLPSPKGAATGWVCNKVHHRVGTEWTQGKLAAGCPCIVQHMKFMVQEDAGLRSPREPLINILADNYVSAHKSSIPSCLGQQSTLSKESAK